ncbi:hypothetical protein MOB49_02835 [Bacillus haynesii]|uniref:hypothetical protein n=1 Tax=Bacillus TaxID=1386 RepID=UPI0012B9E49C|nr:hypothetical protein [Bacillus haynesii]MCY7801532.1 hypothetical protein [Bacillus haynesii]MCY7844740.1 hypothetical protein [Bacillus haynesii]MCY7966009.1 hypothetical protein [Bacillus haynesii]MCY7990953.1 hypothetical protein [Bacillus haynesii]MCY8018030.1 hypothetical protein [Bacillus haynesii]
MFIKYNEYDLLELFESEPVSIADDPEAGELVYTFKDNQNFKLILTLDVYQLTCSLDITYKDFSVFTGVFHNVTSIKKIEDFMVVSIEEEERIKVKFTKQIGVELL